MRLPLYTTLIHFTFQDASLHPADSIALLPSGGGSPSISKLGLPLEASWVRLSTSLYAEIH